MPALSMNHQAKPKLKNSKTQISEFMSFGLLRPLNRKKPFLISRDFGFSGSWSQCASDGWRWRLSTNRTLERRSPARLGVGPLPVNGGAGGRRSGSAARSESEGRDILSTKLVAVGILACRRAGASSPAERAWQNPGRSTQCRGCSGRQDARSLWQARMPAATVQGFNARNLLRGILFSKKREPPLAATGKTGRSVVLDFLVLVSRTRDEGRGRGRVAP